MQVMPVKHRMKQNQKTKKSAHCIKRPKVLMVGDSVVYNTNFRIVEKILFLAVKKFTAQNSLVICLMVYLVYMVHSYLNDCK